MSYSISVFSAWTSYGTWDALKAWLQSKEGGSLRVVEPKESDLVLIRYTKGVSDFSLPHVSWCRSVVLNKKTLLVVSVAPPKAKKVDDAENNASEYTSAEEFVDGSMMNIFRDATLGLVDVSTRSRLGGKNQFYSGGPTFLSMLKDALVAGGKTDVSELLPSTTDTNCFTSIVLQHSQNRVVKSITTPTVYVIHQGSVSADGVVSIVEDPVQLVSYKTPLRYNLESILTNPTVKQWVVQQSQEHGYEWQGVVFKNGQGARWRIRSEVYETVRHLRGNDASLEERFARLRKSRTLEQYITFYSEDRQVMYDLEGVLRENTRRLHNLYVSVFIVRENPFHELPWPFKHHVSVLHNLYKDVLRPHGKKMNVEEVVRYVNRLDFKDTANLCKKFEAPKKLIATLVPNTSVPDATCDAPTATCDAPVLDVPVE